MPMGVNNGNAAFQRMLENVLECVTVLTPLSAT